MNTNVTKITSNKITTIDPDGWCSTMKVKRKSNKSLENTDINNDILSGVKTHDKTS
jgi:hypothetical protein